MSVAMRKKMKVYTGRPQWYHPKCMFASFARTKCGTTTINSTDDIEGFNKLPPSQQQYVKSLTADANPFTKLHVMDALIGEGDPVTPDEGTEYTESELSEALFSDLDDFTFE